MKKLPVFLLATLVFSYVAYTPTAQAQTDCKPNLMKRGILKRSRTSTNLVRVSGSVENRSKKCTAYMVWAVFKYGRQYKKTFVGNIRPGEEVHFDGLIDAGRARISLEKFEY